MDMRFYWLKDREAKKQFKIFWRAGKLNKGDYHTKHHRPTLFTPRRVVEALRNKLKGLTGAVRSSAARVC